MIMLNFYRGQGFAFNSFNTRFAVNWSMRGGALLSTTVTSCRLATKS